MGVNKKEKMGWFARAKKAVVDCGFGEVMVGVKKSLTCLTRAVGDNDGKAQFKVIFVENYELTKKTICANPELMQLFLEGIEESEYPESPYEMESLMQVNFEEEELADFCEVFASAIQTAA